MTEKPVKEILLDNGLNLLLYDESRPLAGDRYLVRLTARMEIPVEEISFPRDSGTPEPLEMLGPMVVFEQKKDRHFVSEKDKEETFHSLCNEFLGSLQSYLSHPEFAKKFVLRQYMEKAKKRKWEKVRDLSEFAPGPD